MVVKVDIKIRIVDDLNIEVQENNIIIEEHLIEDVVDY